MKSNVVKNVSTILICSAIAKGLSYIWEAILAAYFGASDLGDAFYMTTSIFNILFPILDIGIWKVFLPIYKTKLVEKKEDRAAEIANIAITLFFLLTIGLILFLVVLARPLVAVFAPGFDETKSANTILYLRLCTPYLLFAAVSSLVGAMLQSRELFLGSQIREIGTHVARLACLIICFRYFGVYAAILALIVGGVFRLLVQLPFINWKWKYAPDFNFKDKEIAVMLKGLPSVAVTAVITHLNSLIDRMVASVAASGSISCLNYGNKLMHLFSGLISTAISTAVYPTVIQHIAQKDDQRLEKLLRNVFCALMFFIIPISLFCFLFSGQLVEAAFQRGAFVSSATVLTAEIFVGYCVGMLFLGLTTVVSNVFYGFGDTKITMYISMVDIGLNIVFDLVFYQFWGVAGLAYATSISAMICLGIRLFKLRKYIRIAYKPLCIEAAKILALSLTAGAAAHFALVKCEDWNVFLILIAAAAVFGLIYIVLALAFRLNTLQFVSTLLRKKLKRG